LPPLFLTGDKKVNREFAIRRVLGDFLVPGRRYHFPLPPELAEWYCYTRDGGHSILVVLAADFAEGDLTGKLVPAPVKAVLRGYKRRGDYIVCDLPYSEQLGLLVDSVDEEMGASSTPAEPHIAVQNHGPLITSTNYWESELARAGKLFVSPNAGAIRVLLPPSVRPVLNELRAAEYAILSRGPWRDVQAEVDFPEAVEILWEDHTDSPHAWHLTPGSFALLPAEPPPGQDWIISLWDNKKGKPHKALERRCYWRRVPRIPWLKPWEKK
jgi:hypothetical protein